jgi:hypothetical protein
MYEPELADDRCAHMLFLLRDEDNQRFATFFV